MASKRMLVFATILFCLLFSMSISGQDISKHLVIENGSKLGFTGGSEATKSPGDSISGSSNKAEQKTYVYIAGYISEGLHGGQPWHGVRAEISVWRIPDVQPLSSSGAYIAAIYKSPEQELIAAGFHVNPGLYNDNFVHFFTYWTNRSDYSTGCYNDDCPGFVIANETSLYPGQAFENRSFTIRIKRDEHTGDWSLYREDEGGPIGGMTLLGWWPGSLFKSLSEHADVIQWTGFVSHNYNETSPSMGSGRPASELDGKAASFNDCFGFDENGYVYDDGYSPIPFVTKSDCYAISDWYETKHAARRHFFYGGPGGCSK